MAPICAAWYHRLPIHRGSSAARWSGPAPPHHPHHTTCIRVRIRHISHSMETGGCNGGRTRDGVQRAGEHAAGEGGERRRRQPHCQTLPQALDPLQQARGRLHAGQRAGRRGAGDGQLPHRLSPQRRGMATRGGRHADWPNAEHGPMSTPPATWYLEQRVAPVSTKCSMYMP